MARYKSRGEAIKDLRKQAGFSQEELANMLDTTKQTIYKYENGIVTNIPSDKIEEMSRIFSVSPAVIMGWDEPEKPIFEVAAGTGRISDGPADTINIQLRDDQCIATVKGRSMEPTLMDGDQVVIDCQSVLDYDGQIAMVKINGEENTLKRIQLQEGGITLIGDNTDVFPPKFYTAKQVEELPIRIMGVVSMLVRKIK